MYCHKGVKVGSPDYYLILVYNCGLIIMSGVLLFDPLFM